jgi:4-amino-4-deoxy-L-arabinose transferase-like glycosyltransferase
MQTRTFVFLLLLGAFVVRLGTVLAFREIQEGPTGEISNDDVQFHRLSVNLRHGYGYRVTPDRPLTSFRAPGFPLVLAGLYAVTGDNPAAAYLLFCLLGATACVLTYALAREVMAETGARLVGVFAAIYLPHVYVATTFISENVYVPCVALGLWLIAHFVNQRCIGMLAAAGLALGWATLTRPSALLLLPILLCVLAWNDVRLRGGRPLAYLLFTIGFVGVILPWTLRNYEVHGKWILVATNGGTTFWGGNNDLVLNEPKHCGYSVPSTELPDHERIDGAANEVERDEIEWKLGKDWLQQHWASMPLLGLYKFARLWWLPDFGAGRRWLRILGYVPFLLLFLLFAVRCVWRKSCWTASWQVLHAGTLALFAMALIFCGEPRYRDAHAPVLMVYAALGVMPRPLCETVLLGEKPAR